MRGALDRAEKRTKGGRIDVGALASGKLWGLDRFGAFADLEARLSERASAYGRGEIWFGPHEPGWNVVGGLRIRF